MKKTSKIASNLTKAALTLALIVGTGSIANAVTGNDSLNVLQPETEMTLIENEVLAMLEDEDKILEDLEFMTPRTIKIMDQHENVICERIIARDGEIEDKGLLVLMQRSDFVMKHENTSYYLLHH